MSAVLRVSLHMAVAACIRALEAGLVLHLFDSSDGTTTTAGPFRRADGASGWAVYTYRRGAQAADEDATSAGQLARRVVVRYAGNGGRLYRAYLAARVALFRAGEVDSVLEGVGERRGRLFRELVPTCPERRAPAPLLRRPANALNVEPIQPFARCRLQTPKAWGDQDPRAARWLASGGDDGVLGACDCAACPRLDG